MLYVLDTSALVKRYHRETGSEIVEKLFQEPSNILLISVLSLSETARALDRLQRQGIYSLEDIRFTLQRLYQDCRTTRIGLIDVISSHVFKANELILRYHLSAADAIILATALQVRSHQPVFVSADVRSGLLRAAEACHLSTLNPLSL